MAHVRQCVSWQSWDSDPEISYHIFHVRFFHPVQWNSCYVQGAVRDRQRRGAGLAHITQEIRQEPRTQQGHPLIHSFSTHPRSAPCTQPPASRPQQPANCRKVEADEPARCADARGLWAAVPGNNCWGWDLRLGSPCCSAPEARGRALALNDS